MDTWHSYPRCRLDHSKDLAHRVMPRTAWNLQIPNGFEFWIKEHIATRPDRANVKQNHPRFFPLRLVLEEDRVVISAFRARHAGVRQCRIVAQVCSDSGLLSSISQQVIPVHCSIRGLFFGVAGSAPHDHTSTNRIRFRREYVVTFLTKGQGGHGVSSILWVVPRFMNK